MKLLGAILAGGRSSRFGSDKALADLDGLPLIAHAAASIAAIVDTLVVCGRDGEPHGIAGIADRPAPDLGPLGGLCGALYHAGRHGFDAVLTIGCDTPALPPELVARVAAHEGACFVRQLPVIGRWPAGLSGALERHLAEGDDRSIRRWAITVGALPVDADATLANVNRPEDLARLQTRS